MCNGIDEKADRKKELIEFEDTFGRSIGEWKVYVERKLRNVYIV